MIPEDMLRQAAREAQRAYLDSLPEPADCRHTFSPAFARRMKRLLRKKKPTPLRRGLRRVAGFVLVVLLCGTLVLSTNARAYEAFFGWVREQVEGAQGYFHQGEDTPSSEIVRYQIDIPEGYWLEDSTEVGGFFDYFYANESNEYITFTYQYVTENSASALYVDDREAERQQVIIHGNPADLYISYSEEADNTIVWFDKETGALINVNAFMGKEDLIKLAESVVPVEN